MTLPHELLAGVGDVTSFTAPDANLLKGVLDTIPARVAVLARDYRYLYGNREFLAFMGRPSAEVIGRPAPEVIGPEAFARLLPFAERVLAGEPVRWEGWFSYPGGTDRYVQQYLTPYRTEAGLIEGFFVFTRDLTEVKQQELHLAQQVEALRLSEALGAAIVSSSLDCVIVVDEAGRVVEFNPAAEQTFGYSRDEAVGRLIGDLIVPHDQRQQHDAGMQRYMATGRASVLGRRVELTALHRDGSTLPVELAITEVKLPERRLFTAHLRDLTASKRVTAEIERQRDALYQSEKLAALGSLLAGVAHELNNPLSIVIGQALMMQEAADELGSQSAALAVAERARKIQTAADRCARIVRSFLAIARQKKTEREPVDLRALAEGAVELLSYGLRATGVSVRIDMPDKLPRALADGNQVHQVLANLIINAQQALQDHPGDRQIRIAAELVPERSIVMLRVSDSGPGVPQGIATRIFDPFFTTKPQGEGTGIGLSVSRGLVESNGGTLTLARDPDLGGASFHICLPLSDGSGVVSEAGASALPRASGRRALIVDDEDDIGLLLGEIVTRAGFETQVVRSGREAQEHLTHEGHPFDVILCDMRMPDMDGPALFRWLEQERPSLTERIIFVTGDTLGPSVGRFLARSGCPVVEKPFVPSDIHQAIAGLSRPAA
jgi:two-component system NtrC family sensor kinase